MTTARIDFATALAPGVTFVPVILVAGAPTVLTPAGVRPTTVAVTSGSIDPLFWCGTGSLTETLPDASTFDPVDDLLDPREVFEVFERASLLDGAVKVEPFTFTLIDTDGRATAMLSIREGRTAQLLAAEVSDTATTVTLASVGGFPASGIAAIGRETFLYSSISGNDLVTSLVTRGRYGSRVRTHGAPAEHLPVVTAGGPRHWQGRVCTLWLCTLSADGATLGDPTLLYAGTVGAGVQLTGDLRKWSVPLDHVTETLARKVDTPPVDLYGFAHYTIDPGAHPLLVGSEGNPRGLPWAASLQWSDGDNDNGGWHPSLSSFVDAANRAFDAYTTGAGSLGVDSNGKLVVRVQGSSASPRWFSSQAAWDANVVSDYRVDDDTTPAAWISGNRAPQACFRLLGRVRIPTAADFARIPTTFSWTHTTTDGDTGTASLGLVASVGEFKDIASLITARDATPQTVTVTPVGPAPLFTARTAAKLGVIASGSSCIAALRAGALGLEALTGSDLYDALVDWDDLERALSGTPSGGLPTAREYRFISGADSFLAVLIDELRLRGMCLAMRYGRITGVRMQSLSDVESAVASIGELDPIHAEAISVTDATEPLATKVVFKLPNPAGSGDPVEVSVTDATFEGEFGDGEALEVGALLNVPARLIPGVVASLSALYAVSQQILGPLAEPSRAVGLPLTGALLGLQPGDRVRFTHPRVPTWTGVRGVSDLLCQVQEVRRQLFGGKLRATAVLRLQSSVSCAYTPEVIVAAGGLTGGSPVVTIDATTGWGPQCHASDRTAAGAVSTNAVDGFAVGDAVILGALDDRTPIADEPFTVTAVNVGAGTVTLSGNPSAGMVAAAVSQYGVTLRWGDYDDATASQHTGWGWVADATTGTLGTGGAEGKRWAA